MHAMMSDPLSNALIRRASALFGAIMYRSSRTAGSDAVRIALAAGAVTAASTVSADDEDANDMPPNVPNATVPPLREEDASDKRQSSTLQSLGEQLSFGGVLGFAAGYSIRKVGKAALFLVGTEVVILQYMAYRQWLIMDWRRLGRDLAPKFSRSAWEGLMEILVYKMPFSAAFSGGLLAGLRLSSPKR